MVTKRQSIFENPSAHRTVDRLVHEVDPHHVPETVDKLVSKITLKTELKHQKKWGLHRLENS